MDYEQDELLSELEEAESLYNIDHKVLHDMKIDKRLNKKKNKNKSYENKGVENER
jgi:hypothetical protein